MIKYGGSGKSKQACIKRNCVNAVDVEVKESDDEDDNIKQGNKMTYQVIIFDGIDGFSINKK